MQMADLEASTTPCGYDSNTMVSQLSNGRNVDILCRAVPTTAEDWLGCLWKKCSDVSLK